MRSRISKTLSCPNLQSFPLWHYRNYYLVCKLITKIFWASHTPSTVCSEWASEVPVKKVDAASDAPLYTTVESKKKDASLVVGQSTIGGSVKPKYR